MADSQPRVSSRSTAYLARLNEVSDKLCAAYGPQYWWPAENRFEIIVGAVLTQNTVWINVERAIDNLKQAGVLKLDAMLALEQQELAERLRPAGYFNLKARRLTNLLSAVRELGGVDGLARIPTLELRSRLLAVNGVGPETADDILLYAYHRPVFVVDAYTRRIFSRVGLALGDEAYDTLRLTVESAMPENTSWYQEFHALIVVHGKERCRPRPGCHDCPLAGVCDFPQ